MSAAPSSGVQVYVSQPKTPPPVHVAVGQQNVFGEEPVQTYCGNCRTTVTTVTNFETSVAAYCLCGLWAFCCDCLQDVVHRCPICRNQLGKLERF